VNDIIEQILNLCCVENGGGEEDAQVRANEEIDL
jgi:hypothetical protein